jgi:hypothetical protein
MEKIKELLEECIGDLDNAEQPCDCCGRTFQHKADCIYFKIHQALADLPDEKNGFVLVNKNTINESAKVIEELQQQIGKAVELLYGLRVYDEWEKEKIIQALQGDKCQTCGGDGFKYRKEHCSIKMCIKHHNAITCCPDGVQCEYYIPKEPCPACQKGDKGHWIDGKFYKYRKGEDNE